MKIAVDFDDTIVIQVGRKYEDVTSPLVFVPGAKAGLWSLKNAGHKLLLWSGRASPTLLEDPDLDPLVRAGATASWMETWLETKEVHRARFDQMVKFVADKLPGVFDAIDDGRGGKPAVDMFIDDKAMRLSYGVSGSTWADLARTYGDSGLRSAGGAW